MKTILSAVLALGLASTVFAQTKTLPAPSRTVFKCEQAGKVVYSDEPCLGAERINVEPNRGLNQYSGKERIGKDVRREQDQEMWAEALRPLTGKDAKQYKTFGDRLPLSPQARQECAALDQAIPAAEAREKLIDSRAAAQRELFELRQRFRTLKC
jgi:hypothetical protein